MPDPKYLSKIAIGDDTYDFKDSEARNEIKNKYDATNLIPITDDELAAMWSASQP